MQRRHLLAALAAGLLATPALAQTPPMRVRGTILSLDSNSLTVQMRDGDTAKIALAPGYTVVAVVPSALDAIKPGSMIGIVGFGPAKQQRAAVISIFPPGSTVNAAQFPWDSQPDSVMTNAPVTSQVDTAEGRTLTVTVKDEKIEVTVPKNAVIQTTEPGTVAMLTPGAHVLVVAQKGADGALTSSRLFVGKDGFVPAN